MDNERRGLQEEEDMWKRALLSRDFDLCHTRLLMLDGQVEHEERLHLVKELFLTIKEIEGIVLKEPIKTSAKSTLEELTSVRNTAQDMVAACDSQNTSTRRSEATPQLPETNAQYGDTTLSNKCNICQTRKRKPSRHFCDCCRIFANRLLKMHKNGVPLPMCDHKGKKILYGCKGCRRYCYQQSWPLHTSKPFPLPKMEL